MRFDGPGGRVIVRRAPRLVEREGRRTFMPGDPKNPAPQSDTAGIETRFVFVDGRWRGGR
jgi:hypothetical protein